ncbi:uncharacterized protein FFMR_09987 [Fusarium fujikuroi]|nr:uncharacterized protein FFMR_09987 [Fusarium fujikuroi]
MKGGLTCSSESMIPKFQGLSGFLSQTNYRVPLDTNHSPVQYSLRADKHPFSILRDNLFEYKGEKAYLMRLILHSRPDAKCVPILAYLLEAVRKGYSRLLINETTPRDVGAPWL